MNLAIKNKIKGFNTNVLFLIFSFGIIIFTANFFNWFIDNKVIDIYDHFNHALNIPKENKVYPANFLLYLLITLSKNYTFSRITFIFILCFSIWLKFYITYLIINKSINIKKNLSILTAFIFTFSFSLPSLFIFSGRFFYGNYTYSVWHNSTTIFLMPFALLLFYNLFYKNKSIKQNLIIFVLIILNLIIKPSYIFVIIPLLGILILYDLFINKNKESKGIYSNILLIAFSVLFITIQYYSIYVLNKGSIQTEKSAIELTFTPFSNFDFYQRINLPFALIISYIFPIFYFININKEKITKINILAIVSVIIALLIYFFITETGPRRHHGNFYWQIIPTSYILYLTTFISFINNYYIISLKVRKILLSIFILNFIFGLIYITKIYLTHTIH